MNDLARVLLAERRQQRREQQEASVPEFHPATHYQRPIEVDELIEQVLDIVDVPTRSEARAKLQQLFAAKRLLITTVTKWDDKAISEIKIGP
jgi:hypothetical protein